MNEQQFKSLTHNLTEFTKKLSDAELVDVIKYICYDYLEQEPSKLATEFIMEFFGMTCWENTLADAKNPDTIFFKASMTQRDLVRNIRIAIMQEAFFRLVNVVNATPVPKKEKTEKLTIADKKALVGIFAEHKAMLEYQLEDEDAIRNVDSEKGNELIDEKKRHLEAINKVTKLKLF